MTIQYDKVADAMYMRLAEGTVAKTIRVNDHMIVDMDSNDNTLGIEILEASSQEELVASLQDNVSNGFPVNITESTPVLG